VRRQYDGFWFPPAVRDAIITPERAFEVLHFKGGGWVSDPGDDTVTVRWPRLELSDWQQVLSLLERNQRNTSQGNTSDRLPRAMQRMKTLWSDRSSPLRQDILEALETCTGHSMGMLDISLSLLDMMSVEDLQRASNCQFTHAVKNQFAALDGLPGKIRFFVDGWWSSRATQALLRLESYRQRRWQLRRQRTERVLGYAAGNVPGTGLLIVLLALAATAEQSIRPPVILVRNSRREPLFTPLVLTALELVDRGLLNTTLVTLWDHADTALQESLFAQADLVVAAASDETIEDIGQKVQRVSSVTHPIRFHGHGHKVSFSTVGRECLRLGKRTPLNEVPLVDAVALLASLDVALWNQQGCLSSRVHFLEQGNDAEYHPPEVYGQAVVRGLRTLNKLIPKGISRKRQIHNLFDKYQAVGASGPVKVLSDYDDDFLVVLERRPLTATQFGELVNDCQGRTVAIIPVDDVMEIPERYLRYVHRTHLQSMSVALGNPDEPGIDPRLLRYAEALGAVGVTGIRTVGRGAFPQLAYSWDGLIPLDLTAKRQKGYFTALEFDEPWVQIHETHRLVRQAIENRM
jgi:hypothetical protein